jgi:hypothetical protein
MARPYDAPITNDFNLNFQLEITGMKIPAGTFKPKVKMVRTKRRIAANNKYPTVNPILLSLFVRYFRYFADISRIFRRYFLDIYSQSSLSSVGSHWENKLPMISPELDLM